MVIRGPLALAAVAVLTLACSCGQVPEPPGAAAIWTLSPAAPRLGVPAEAQAILSFGSGVRPVLGATLDFEAHMSHPGMAPVVVRATERQPGCYVASIQFSMSGDWVVFVSGTLSDGTSLRQRIADVVVAGAE